jgi:hypothetical protein
MWKSRRGEGKGIQREAMKSDWCRCLHLNRRNNCLYSLFALRPTLWYYQKRLFMVWSALLMARDACT